MKWKGVQDYFMPLYMADYVSTWYILLLMNWMMGGMKSGVTLHNQSSINITGMFYDIVQYWQIKGRRKCVNGRTEK